jgi:hypothetical protein
MKRTIVWLVFVVLVTLMLVIPRAIAQNASALNASSRFILITLDAFDAQGASAVAINDSGDILGQMNDHCLLFRNGQFSTLRYPGAASTVCTGLNNHDEVAGQWFAEVNDAATPSAFVYRNGVFTNLGNFGPTGFFAVNGVNNQGTVFVGVPAQLGWNLGFISDGALQIANYPGPGVINSEIGGFNDHGTLVGTWQIERPLAQIHGFIWSGANVKTIDFPAASSTNPVAINNRNEVIGQYNGSHGFLYRRGQFVTVDGPGAVFTTLTSINSQGWIVGEHLLGAPLWQWHALLVMPRPQ